MRWEAFNMLKTIAFITVLTTSCGIFKSKSGPPSDQTQNLTSVAETSAHKKNTWEATALTSEPDVETYSGRCISSTNEGFLNNAGETCSVVEQHYDAASDICSEKISCELHGDEEEVEE
jgi:hypothetical protein